MASCLHCRYAFNRWQNNKLKCFLFLIDSQLVLMGKTEITPDIDMERLDADKAILTENYVEKSTSMVNSVVQSQYRKFDSLINDHPLMAQPALTQVKNL